MTEEEDEKNKKKMTKDHLSAILRANAHGPEFKQYPQVCMYVCVVSR